MHFKFFLTILACLASSFTHAEKHKDFGDYTTYVITQSKGVIYKQANVKLDGVLDELEFHAHSDNDKVFAFVNKKPVLLIVDGNVMDNELEPNEVKMLKDAHNLAVIHDSRTYLVSTKGSGASMIYITDFPRLGINKSIDMSSDSTSSDNFNKREVEKKLAYISEVDAYSRFNDEWKRVCHREKARHEEWRLANIEPILSEFKRVSIGMDFGSTEVKALNNVYQNKIKKLVDSSNEWKAVLACEEAHLNTQGYTTKNN
ncbi:hypothetical protein ACK342_10000 [Aeromonas veronii]|uniref:hypothetical protein n=1 Tax=Aeromonas veronii TaxID=654 RepID=UPI000AB784B0|nr:hypothetical protein [Aeromonas veronii]